MAKNLTIDDVDEVNLELVQDSDHWADKQFELVIDCVSGRTVTLQLDGLHVVDIIGDGLNAGLPESWSPSPEQLENLPQPGPFPDGDPPKSA